MEKKIYTHTTAYYSVLKKEILSFVTTWIELEDIVLGEISQIEKSKYCLIDCLHHFLTDDELFNHHYS